MVRDAERLTEQLAAGLIAEQFPAWADLRVELVVPGGHDNRTFRLGPELTIRLPTDDGYIPGERKEHEWLPRLAPSLPLQIPEIVAIGEPTEVFARPWSVRRWIPGETASASRIADMSAFARGLGEFLAEFRTVDSTGAPAAGAHSFYRGTHPRAYDGDVRTSIDRLRHELDVDRVTAVWEDALSSEWTGPPVWFHGDVAVGNILVVDGRLEAVIDFGTCGVGDPACDTIIAWTFLPTDAAHAFRDALSVDDDTWRRGRGWALWKALITIAEYRATDTARADDARRVLERVLRRDT
jgi:aminoglycoside phosphotransferase (APT) family kinase protein